MCDCTNMKTSTVHLTPRAPMMDDVNVCGAKEESQSLLALRRLGDEIKTAEDSLSQLEMKLGAALSPKTPNKEEDELDFCSGDSVLLCSIDTERRNVRTLRERMNSIIDRLEV